MAPWTAIVRPWWCRAAPRVAGPARATHGIAEPLPASRGEREPDRVDHVGHEGRGVAPGEDRLDALAANGPPPAHRAQLPTGDPHEGRLEVVTPVDPLDPAVVLGDGLGQGLAEGVAVDRQEQLDPALLRDRGAPGRATDVRLDDQEPAGPLVDLRLDVAQAAIGDAPEERSRDGLGLRAADLLAQRARAGVQRPLAELPGDEGDARARRPVVVHVHRDESVLRPGDPRLRDQDVGPGGHAVIGRKELVRCRHLDRLRPRACLPGRTLHAGLDDGRKGQARCRLLGVGSRAEHGRRRDGEPGRERVLGEADLVHEPFDVLVVGKHEPER